MGGVLIIRDENHQSYVIESSATLVVDHTLTNLGNEPVELAPWAITQLKPGGVAILPHPSEKADPDGVQPNRSIVLWPYTDIANKCIQWGNILTTIWAELEEGALKIGFPNPRGWLAYLWKDLLFVKRAQFKLGEEYFDLHASSQCYTNPDFLELETLGPKTQIAPENSVSHREVWEMRSVEQVARNAKGLASLVEQHALDQSSQFMNQEFE